MSKTHGMIGKKNGLKHGMCGSPEYNSWRGMRARCNDPNHTKYPIYGAKGITFCEEWESFQNFYADMGPKPGPDYTIDRIDPDGNYEPGNCRWADHETQSRNKRQHKRDDVGVYWDKATKKWRAKISVDYKPVHLGRFDTKEEAIVARTRGETKYWGKSDCLITQEDLDRAGACFDARAELLRSKGAPIKPGECFFPKEYLVIVEIIERRVPGQFPVKAYKYEWMKKDGEKETKDTSQAA